MVTVQAGDEVPLRPHDRVSVEVNAAAAHLFEASGLSVPRVRTESPR
jgi:hypothetical protein